MAAAQEKTIIDHHCLSVRFKTSSGKIAGVEMFPSFCWSLSHSLSFGLLSVGIFALIRSIRDFTNSSKSRWFVANVETPEGKARRTNQIVMAFCGMAGAIACFHVFIRKMILRIRLDDCVDTLLVWGIPFFIIFIVRIYWSKKY